MPGPFRPESGQLELIATPLSLVSVISADPTWVMDYLSTTLDLGKILEKGQVIELENLNFPQGEFDLMQPEEIELMAAARFQEPGDERQAFVDLAVLGQGIRMVRVEVLEVSSAVAIGSRLGRNRPLALWGASGRCGVMKVRLAPQYKSFAALAYLFGTEAVVRGLCSKAGP